MSLPSWVHDIEFIDSHVHVIDTKNLNYDVVEFKTSPDLAKDWSEKMYLEDLGDIPIKSLIFEEVNASSDSMLKEVEWVHNTMIRDPKSRFIGIVANVPAERGRVAVAAWLDSLKSYDSVCAARRLIQDMPVGFCTTPEFIEGVREIVKRRLVFDICIRAGSVPQQMNDALYLVQSVPEGVFVLDHVGKPDIAGKKYNEWAEFMEKLAKFPNVFCKISGVVTEAEKDWTMDSIRPYVEQCLKVFGYERCMFGSDWFVCTLNASLRRWFLALCEIVDKASLEQKRALFGGTAKMVYKEDLVKHGKNDTLHLYHRHLIRPYNDGKLQENICTHPLSSPPL